ncbi:MAG TPA: serine protease, partial [Chloroflexi bacterium]|nr:serine protease [Chloroflexota bacterium]
MPKEFTDSIVRILSPDGKTVGAGFVVHEKGLIVTCTHVVEAAGGKPGSRVKIRFCATGEEQEVYIVPEYWRTSDAEDVAILQASLPKKVAPIVLGSSIGVEERTFITFGFPLGEELEGLKGECKVIGRIETKRGFSLLQLHSTQVTSGFSGAPLLDNLTKRVVGMVTYITIPDRYGRLVETAFAIPTETLREVCRDLQISDFCPYRGLDPFTESDAEFFFGRERAVDRLVESLRREPRFLAVLGPSGSGKSSLVQAGLISRLRKGALPGSDRWGIIIARPADIPFQQLEDRGLRGASENLAKAIQAWLDNH